MRVFVVYCGPWWVEIRVSSTPVKRQRQILRVKKHDGKTLVMRSCSVVGGEPVALVPLPTYLGIKTKSRLPHVTALKPIAEMVGEVTGFIVDQAWVQKHLKGAIFVG